jgi:Flp pilus assembly protein TadG
MKRRSNRGRGRGQAVSEFALVFPLFLLVVLIVVDLARAIFVYAVISDAAREGARYAIVHGSESATDNPPVSGPGSGDPNGALYVAPQAKSVAVGVDQSVLLVGACWGFGCQVPANCGTGTNAATAPVANIPVTVRTCYAFQPITFTPIRFLFSLFRVNWSQTINLGAQSTLTITH